MAGNGTDRLESWKEIASFIGRDERTAMRWAKELGMPVQRTPGEKRGRVFASRSEITEWQARLAHPAAESEQDAELPTGSGQIPPGATRARREQDAGLKAGATQSGAKGVIPQAAKSWKRYAIYGGIGALAIVTLLFLLRPTRGGAGVPERAVFEGDTLRALDADGRVLWIHKFPKTPERFTPDEGMAVNDFVRITDLNRDGEREILAVVPTRVGPNPQDAFQTEVDCFSSRGKLLWSYIPQETFQFGEHELNGLWLVLDVFVSQTGGKPAIWVSIVHSEWGNSYVAQLDPLTGHATVRFVNTGIVFKLNEVRTARGAYLLVGGFNNEYEAGSLAIMDEGEPFAASPQTAGTRHKCVSCPEGAPDYYFVFPRSEINKLSGFYEDPVRGILVAGEEIDVSKAAQRNPGPVRVIYKLRAERKIEAVSLRYDSGYDMLHRAWSAEGKLAHALENCPERLHPQAVRLWTPSSGWTDLPVKPAAANQ